MTTSRPRTEDPCSLRKVASSLMLHEQRARVCVCVTRTITQAPTITHTRARAKWTSMGAGASRVAPPHRRHAKKHELEREIDAMKNKMRRLLASVERIQLREGCAANTECTICMESPINAIFLPCAHACVCCACAHGMLEEGCMHCPMCREPIESVSRMFLPSREMTRRSYMLPSVDPLRAKFAQTWTPTTTVRT